MWMIGVGMFMHGNPVVRFLWVIVVLVQFTLAVMLMVMWVRAWMGF